MLLMRLLLMMLLLMRLLRMLLLLMHRSGDRGRAVRLHEQGGQQQHVEGRHLQPPAGS